MKMDSVPPTRLATAGYPDVYINETVQARFLSLSGVNGPALEKGRLLFLPLGEGAYNVQLQIPLLEEETLLSVSYLPQFLSQWPVDLFLQEKAFKNDEPVDYWFELTQPVMQALEHLLEAHPDSELQQTLYRTEAAVNLLRRATDQINMPFTACPVPACRFLAYDTEREKIFMARQILDDSLDETIPLKKLARLVAMNECYLKKGFKTLIGKSVHEYVLWQRSEKAKAMLAEGYNVTQVAALLGFSSISHFSTAFKKATGLKPCELLR